MRRIEEHRALVEHLLSAKRRRKAGILAKEGILALSGFLRSKHNSQPQFDPDPEAKIWSNYQTRSFDPDFFSRATVSMIEDQMNENGLVTATLEHEVHKINGAISYTNECTHRSVFDKTGQRINSLSNGRAGFLENALYQLPPARFIDGVTANLYGPMTCADGNYLHWFVDALARLFMLEQALPINEIDRIVVPPLKFDFQRDSLAYLGFTNERIIELKPLECLRFETLLASSSTRGEGSAVCPDWIIDRYRDLLIPKAKSVSSVGGRKIYVSRRDAPSRKFLNENEVCETLKHRGFDIVELSPLDLENKIAVFRDASCIVSQTGAALANLMFCRQGTKIVELVDQRFVYPLYASIASFRNVEHHAHYFSNDSALGRINAYVVKSTLDIDALERTLDQLGE